MAADLNLAAQLNLDSSQFTRGAAAAAGATAGLRRNLTSMLGPLAGIAAGFLTARSAMSRFREVIELGAELQHQSAQINASAGSILVMRQAMEDSGQSARSAVDILSRMQFRLGGLEDTATLTTQALRALNLDMSEIEDLGVIEQFEKISERIRQVGDDAERVNIVRALFGEEGARALPLIMDPSAIEDARAALGSQIGIFDRSAAVMERASTLWERTGLVVRGAFAGIADQVLPSILGGLEQINSKDFTQLGQNIGKAIAPWFEALGDGVIWDVFFMQGITGAARFFARVFDFGFEMGRKLGAIMHGTFDFAISALKDLWSRALANMQEDVNTILEKLPGFLGGNKRLDIDVPEPENLGIVDAVKRRLEGLGEAKTPAGNLVQLVLGDTADAMMRALFERAEQSRDFRRGLEGDAPGASPDGEGGEGGNDRGVPEMKLQPFTDELARVGGFIGGGGGPQLSYSRRTAAATERMDGRLRSIERLLGQGDSVATWG